MAEEVGRLRRHHVGWNQSSKYGSFSSLGSPAIHYNPGRYHRHPGGIPAQLQGRKCSLDGFEGWKEGQLKGQMIPEEMACLIRL